MKLIFLMLLLPVFALAQTPKRKIMIVSAEMKGAFQTGGLGHATADLAKTMSADFDVEVLLPRYMKMQELQATDTQQKEYAPVNWHEGRAYKQAEFSLWRASVGGVKTTLFAHDAGDGVENYFDNLKDGRYPMYAHGTLEGEGFAALARAQTDYIVRQQPETVVLNDWTAGLVALYLREASERGEKIPKIIFAIHNIRYQGLYGGELSKWIGLDERHWHIDGIAHNGQWSMFKAGLMYSDMVYTVSESYAQEIKGANFGMGMEGIIQLKERQNRMTGILNGIVNDEWDPRHERKGLPYTFSEKDWSGKSRGKAELQAALGLKVDASAPLVVMTSRIDEQKGFAYLIGAIDHMLETSSLQFAISGDPVKGDRWSEGVWSKLEALMAKHPDRIQVRPFNSALEKQFMAYGDFFTNGAWFEPCGLNQFFALRGGTIPLVSNVGGLKDSVHDGVNGFKFEVAAGSHGENYDIARSTENAITLFKRAVQLYGDRSRFEAMRTRAILEDHSWSSRINKYYKTLLNYVRDEGWKSGPIRYVEPKAREIPLHAPNVRFGFSAHPVCRDLFASAIRH